MQTRLIKCVSALLAATMLFSGCNAVSAVRMASRYKGHSHKGYSQNAVTKSSSNSYTSKPAVTENGISVYFPRAGQDAEGQLVSQLSAAKKTLDIAIYTFTDYKVANAVISAKKRGVAVRLISDRECSGNVSQQRTLSAVKSAGIPIKINSHQGLMHLKVSIIDDNVATTGSFNYTAAAQNENDENFVVIQNPQIAQTYEDEFNRMWNDTSNFQNW